MYPTESAQLLVNASVVLRNSVEKVSVLIEGGIIRALDPISTSHAQKVDLQGRFLIPGLVDLHCDALEKEVEPRPGVSFPALFACQQADRRNAAAGITTIYHSLSFANHELGVRNNVFARQLCETVAHWNQHALVDNRIHARYEITDATAPEHLRSLMESGCAQMISFMDHTPGQGQVKDIEAYRSFLMRTYNKSQDEFEQILLDKQAASVDAMRRVESLAEIARSRGIAIASHDDDQPGKVDLLKALGASISEFPINMETALHASRSGLATLFGAPNILRGKSQSGSMKALDAVLADVADCLCGDYSPAALLPAAFRLVQLSHLTLPQAIALVSVNPARAAGLNDRGEIAAGKRADLVAVLAQGDWPQIETVWCSGRRVFSIAAASIGALADSVEIPEHA